MLNSLTKIMYLIVIKSFRHFLRINWKKISPKTILLITHLKYLAVEKTSGLIFWNWVVLQTWTHWMRRDESYGSYYGRGFSYEY